MQSAAGALAEAEGGRGSLRGKRRSGGSWNSSSGCYHVAAHALESAQLPAHLSEGAGASDSKVLEGRWYFQEPSGAALFIFFFLFSWKNICLTTPLLFLYCKRYFVSLMCLFFESRYGIGKKITQGRMSKEMCREVVGFSFPPFIAELRR